MKVRATDTGRQGNPAGLFYFNNVWYIKTSYKGLI